MSGRPAHHRRNGRFRNPWPEASGDDDLRKRFPEVAREWRSRPAPADPTAEELPRAAPEVARPGARDEPRITWVGHATFLVQLPGLNLLTDPMWSDRPSPVSWAGTKRWVPPQPGLDRLPAIDAVVISHDHYDHLDVGTVKALRDRFGERTTWLTPLGYRSWFRRLGVRRVTELDWWEEAVLADGRYRLVAAPARHWTRRTPWDTNRRLWCSWAVVPAGAEGSAVYFGGDSGFGGFYREIGERLGAFAATILPIGAYDPRWFMHASHMDPAEAVEAYRLLGGRGLFVPGHWGTFRMTYEPPLEPPELLRRAWDEAGFTSEDLRVLQHGETIRVPGSREGASPRT